MFTSKARIASLAFPTEVWVEADPAAARRGREQLIALAAVAATRTSRRVRLVDSADMTRSPLTPAGQLPATARTASANASGASCGSCDLSRPRSCDASICLQTFSNRPWGRGEALRLRRLQV